MSYVILDQDLDVCGVLDLNGRGCKFYDDVRSTKIADEQGKIFSDTLEISVPYGYQETDYITQGYHLLKEAKDGYTYCYRLYNSIDSARGATHVKKALGINLIAWDLTKKIVPTATFNLANSQDVFEHILQGSGWEIRHNGFFGDSKPVTFTAGQNGMYWLDQQIANFNVEIRAYVEVYNGKIIRKLVDIVEEIGESKGYRLEYSHDLLGLTRSIDDSQMYTKLFVYGGNDANNKPVTITSVNGNRDYIVDDAANDLHNAGRPYLEGYITNQDITNPGALLDWGRDVLKRYNHPKHTYTVDISYLGYMPNLGDHFQIVDFSMSPELTISARTIQLDESEANPTNNKIVVGEFIDIIVVTPSDVRKLQAEAAAANAELQKAIALKNTFFRQDTEPTTATEGDFWIYTGTDSFIYPIQRLEGGVWIAVDQMKGEQGIPGQPGADGRTTYLHIAYADDANGNGFAQSPTAKAYMGTYVDFIQNDSTNPTDYTWAKIQGPQGPQGPTGLQGLQGPQGNQGLQGPQGADGLSSYTHIAYAKDSTGTVGFSISDSTGAVYIGMYVDNTVNDSIDPSKYKWTLIKGADGAQGIQGPTGADGQTPYLHIAYATNANGTTGFSVTESAGKTYMGTYTDYTAADSTDPTKYRWVLIQGPQGPQGAQGIQGLQGLQGPQGDQGLQGPAGTSSYTHIAYATNYQGTTGFSLSDSNGKSYIGMYVDSNPTDSTDPTKYKWSLIKGADGAQGVQGPAGADGQTPYLHIAYATNATGTTGFSITDPTNATYIGTYTDYNVSDSVDPSLYTWAKIQGPQGPIGATGPQGLQGLQGPKGDQGIQGPAGTSSYTHIAYATNSTGTAGFSTGSSVGATYIGMYVDNVATDSTDPTKYEWTLIKGADGAQGVPGPAGVDGQTPYLHIAYATNATGSTGFSTTDATGKTYIGTYTDFSQNDSTDPTKYTWSLIKGADGATGKGISSVTEYYLVSSANTGVTTATAGWSTTMPTLTSTNKYMWNYRKVTYTDSTSVNTTPGVIGAYGDQGIQGAKGDQGIQGVKGADGVTTYTWVKYADDQYGGNMSDSAIGKRYLGLAYNKTTQTESTAANDYTWSPLYDNVNPDSRNFILNSYYDWDQEGALATTYTPPTEGVLTISPDLVRELNKSGSLTLTLLYKTTNVVWGTTNPWAGYQLTITYSDATKSYWDCGGNKIFQTNTSDFVQQVNFYQVPSGKTVSTVEIAQLVRDLTGLVEMRQCKAAVGNVTTAWGPAPEDIQTSLDTKAADADLDALAGAVSLVNSQLNEKADAGDFGALKDSYDAYVAQAKLDADSVAASLSTMDGRVALVETLAGDSKIVTDFINTVITESEEGIYISNKNSATGILISSNRISFMDNGVEVAYISNQTMQINHGIFVESATIANFHFELIPGTTILSIGWVGA